MSCRLKTVVRAVTLFVAALLLPAVAGCTEIERNGYSPIPQNSPGGWEVNPYNF